ncbi:hypothetical protein PMAYCL1PPCAC_00842, partial [Pristionchus mayeri]
SIPRIYLFFVFSLHIDGTYNRVSKEEIVHVQVDRLTLDFFGSNKIGHHFGPFGIPQTVIVAVEWERKTKEANWVLQLDFEIDGNPVETSEIVGHVRFTHSEALQESALASIDNTDRAPFKRL